MIKKALTYSVVVTTIIWSVGLLATPLAVGAAVSGDLIKLQCAAGADVNDPCKAVYYLGADGKRYVFPNEKTYKTWYSDFSGVQIVSSTEMSSYTIGGNVTYRPGVKLVKINTDPKVYAVAANGTLRWVTTAALAGELYEANWASKVEDVPDAFFVNYTVGTDITAASDYDKAAETSAAETINEDKNLSGGISAGTSLTVALAADTPASGIVVGNSINNKFTKINLTASADGDIVIDSITVRRGGTVASDTPFSSIALIDAATDKRIGPTKSLNSLHQAVFNKDITVSAGTTKSIYLAGNMGATLSYAGEIPSLDLYAVALSGGAAVIGTLPIVGNYQTLNGTITIGTLTLANGANNPSASTQKVGTTNYIVSGFKLTSNSVEDFKVSQITFNQGGTAADADVANLELLVDDAVWATVSAPADKDVFFDLRSNPVTVAKGKSVNFDLRLDIESGSARTIRFDVKDESDVVAKGQLYGAEVKVSASTGATADAEPFWTAVVTAVSEGSLRVGPATLNAANIPDDADQVVLGKFEFEAKGEAVEVTSLPINFKVVTSSASTAGNVTQADLTNITIYDADGNIVAGPDDTAHNAWLEGARTEYVGVTSTDTITFPVGTNVYTVKGDLSSDWESDDTIYAWITPAQMTAKGSNTGLAITPTPTGEQSSAIMTVKAASLAISVSSSPIAQSVVAGTKNHTFANIVLDAANSGENVKITAVKVRVVAGSGANPAETTGWAVYDGSTKLDTSNAPSDGPGGVSGDAGSATATFTLSTPLVITKGTTKTLTFKADIVNAATNGSITVGMADSTAANHVTAKGASSGTTAGLTISVGDGQTQTFTSTGLLTITQHSSTPVASFLPHDSTGLTAAVLSARARYEDVNVEKIYLTGTQVGNGGWDQIKPGQVHLYQGSTLLKSVTPTSSDDNASGTVLFDLTNNPLVVPKDTSVTLTFKVDTPELNYEKNRDGTGLPSSFDGIQLNIAANGDVTAKGAQSGTVLASGASGVTVTSAAGNNMYLVRSFPTITLTESTGTIVAGTATTELHKFTVAADSAADIGLFSVSYQMATTTATVTNMFLYEGGAKVATASTTVIAVGDTAEGSGYDAVHTFILTTDGNVANVTSAEAGSATNVLPTQSVIAAGNSRTYTFKGDIECNTVNCNKVSTPTGGSVTVKFLGDKDTAVGTTPTTANLLVADASQYAYEYSLLWTDFWRTEDQRASTTATTCEQWLNGYLVKTSSGAYLENTSTGSRFSK